MIFAVYFTNNTASDSPFRFFLYFCEDVGLSPSSDILVNNEALCLACDRKPEKFSKEHKQGHSGSHAMAWAAIITPLSCSKVFSGPPIEKAVHVSSTLFPYITGLFRGWKSAVKTTIDMKKLLLLAFALLTVGTAGAQRKTETVEVPKAEVSSSTQKTIKRKVAIGRFSNETQYAKGLFYDRENDPMGKQALDILSAKLAASGKFILLERGDLAALLEESQNGGTNLSTIGADYLIIGSITQFGRKNTGKSGVFSTTKTQTVEAAVSIRLVDVASGLIIYSDEAKGTAELTTKTTLGVGGKADYDATLSDKAISEAIGQLVENIINKCTDKPWRTYFLSYDSDAILIGGGASQGLAAGDTFDVMTKGKKVKNPQTGIEIELPGKKIGTVSVVSTGGDTPETEYSFVTYSGSTPIDANNLTNYYIVQQ